MSKKQYRILLPANWICVGIGCKISYINTTYVGYLIDNIGEEGIDWDYDKSDPYSEYLGFKMYTKNPEDVTALLLRYDGIPRNEE